MITKKNKEQFRSWYFDNDMNAGRTFMDLLSFYGLPFDMQIGVYLSYYDFLGYFITLETNINQFNNMNWIYVVELNGFGVGKSGYNSRFEAYKAALKQLDTLINKKL